MTVMPVAITEHVKEFSKNFPSNVNACIPSKTILIRVLDLINIFIIFQYILGFEELFNKKLSKLFSNFSSAIFFSTRNPHT
jgi:hypothetical protein